MIGLQGDGVDSLVNQHVLMFVLFDCAVLQFAAAVPLQSSQTGMSFAVTLPMYTLIPTHYRALLKRAVLGTDHHIHTTKGTGMSDFQVGIG